MRNELVKEKTWAHFDEMNLIEFPLGILAERVPINKETGQEHTKLVFARTIVEEEGPKEQSWIVRGDPNYGGLPRGYDLDVFVAFMSQWSRSGFEHYLVSLGSVYRLLKATGRRDRPEDYARLEKAIRRWFGVSIEARNALYDPRQRRREGAYLFRLFSSLWVRNTQLGDAPKGAVRVTPEFRELVLKGYLKLTDMERYWRLPSPYSRRLFQYLDKHRGRALRERGGAFEIDGYLLAKKLGTLDQTLKSYTPGKLRDVMVPHLEALKADGYLTAFRFGRGRVANTRLRVIYAAEPHDPAPLCAREAEALVEIGQALREPQSRAYHETVVRQLGAEKALAIMRTVLARAEADPKTHRGKLFTYLSQLERRR